MSILMDQNSCPWTVLPVRMDGISNPNSVMKCTSVPPCHSSPLGVCMMELKMCNCPANGVDAEDLVASSEASWYFFFGGEFSGGSRGCSSLYWSLSP